MGENAYSGDNSKPYRLRKSKSGNGIGASSVTSVQDIGVSEGVRSAVKRIQKLPHCMDWFLFLRRRKRKGKVQAAPGTPAGESGAIKAMGKVSSSQVQAAGIQLDPLDTESSKERKVSV